jgi:hypothetical protein
MRTLIGAILAGGHVVCVCVCVCEEVAICY